ncbi:MAG: DUF4340 domain-containing protein [Planctomycetota bacterium]
MNETKKTGVFWGVAAVVALLSIIIVWPSASVDDETSLDELVGLPLFGDFKDPLVAASLKIVTFDEELGEPKTFEVRKDSETGIWTIPSKSGYPADAVEQMKAAANSLVALDVLDVPTENAEDHSGMGVLEPKIDELSVGDVGVGRLVTFKDNSQKVLASVIIGKEVKDQEGQVYVRKPGQDPVYVVALDDAPLTTKFEEWIEEDLLQLSSIDVEELVLKDYSASLGLGGFDFVRNYDIELAKEGTTWQLTSLKEFDPENALAAPKLAEVESGKEINTQKLQDLTNALDDLKFVDVSRKPEGISANLKADNEFASNDTATAQLASRGFFPVKMGQDGDRELLSANGELTATTKDGVTYILRFGNISGISDENEESEGEESEPGETGGVNRYLLVTTKVDESDFPIPELTPIPQTLEDLDALDKPAPPEGVILPPELNDPETSVDPAADGGDVDMQGAAADDATESADEASDEQAASGGEEATGEKSKEDEQPKKEEGTSEKSSENTSKPETEESGTAELPDASSSNSGEADLSGSGTTGGSGGGQEEDEQTGEPPAEDSTEPAKESDAPTDPEEAGTPAVESEKGMQEDDVDEVIEETEEEKQERLAATQEKITKENERKLEERKERLEKARRQSRSLNERFADWYYVIPEATYSKLRISREELYEAEAPAGPTNPGAMPPGLQGIDIPNFGN